MESQISYVEEHWYPENPKVNQYLYTLYKCKSTHNQNVTSDNNTETDLLFEDIRPRKPDTSEWIFTQRISQPIHDGGRKKLCIM